jgi:adenylate cyclase
MLISLGFSLPFSIMQAVLPGFPYSVPFLVALLAFTLPMGLLMPAMHLHLLDRVRHRSFLVTILRQTLLYMAVLALALSVSLFAVVAWHKIGQGRSLADAASVWSQIVTNRFFLLTLPIALLFVVPIRFFFALSQKLGPGVLGKWIRGYYHEPREEERIFLFLDMKDSTTLAERLGHLEFSALVRDFFQDLTLPVLQTRCEVSHYIGDEAVLTWTMERGLERANCVRFFGEFEKALERRSGYYRQRYGLLPEFKAGAHFGPVMATEVGEIKSEIVYHGDVLNTAARIQGLCGPTGERFLLSEDLAARIALPEDWGAAPLGAFDLKGKEAEVGIVAVRRRMA